MQQQLFEAMSRLPTANPFEVTAHILSTFRFVLDILKGNLASSEDLVFNDAKCKSLKDMATVTLLQLFRMVSVFADQVRDVRLERWGLVVVVGGGGLKVGACLPL